MQGDYRSFFRGTGLELSQLREYQPGDDVRAIDWNVTARMQVPYVRELIEDREITAWFLLDMSPSMDYGAPGRTKRDLLAEVTAVFARLLTFHGNRIGAVLFSGREQRVIAPAGGRTSVVRLLAEIEAVPRHKRAPRTDLGTLIGASRHALTRRSFVFLLSDFMTVEGWERPLSLLARRHEVLAVRLSDPSEETIPDVGPVVLADAETGEQLFVDTHDRGFRARFAEAAAGRRARMEAALRRAGVEGLALTTESDIAREVVHLAARRKAQRSARAAAGGDAAARSGDAPAAARGGQAPARAAPSAVPGGATP